mgnify:CR=1 FL=1
MIFVVMVDRAARQARRAVRQGTLEPPWRSRRSSAAVPPARDVMLIATVVMTAVLVRRAVRRRLSGVPDEGAVLRALRVRVQPAASASAGSCRSATRCSSARPAMPRAHARQGLGLAARSSRSLLGTARGGGAGRRRRAAGDPAAGHLFRDDHARAGADDLLLLPAGAVHRAARTASSRCRAASCSACSTCPTRSSMYYVVLGDLPRRRSCSSTASCTRRSGRC